MLASLIIVFREVIEAGLIVGIVLAATNGIAGSRRWVIAGIAGGVAGAILLALFAGRLAGALDGFGQEVFTTGVLLVAVLMLGWHSVWMSRHGAEIAREMKALGREVGDGRRSLTAMAVVVALAVLREGSEVVLFLFGIASASTEGWPPLLAGGAIGIALGALVSVLIFKGLVLIPTRHLFKVTNGLIILLAAGMAGQAAALLVGIDALPSLGDRLWDTSRLLSEDGLAGRAAHALIGYSAEPSGLQVIVWLTTLLGLSAATRRASQRPAARPARARG